MRRNNKIFLRFAMIFFVLVGIIGCSNSKVENTINANYVETCFDEDVNNGQFILLDNYSDLVTLLGNDTPYNYNDSFFEENLLFIIKIIESSDGNKSKIKSYTIIDNVLNIYIETEIYSDTCVEGHWWFILELSKAEVNNIKNVKIFINNDEIIKETMITKLFYSLQEAYNNSWLSIEDLNKIASFHNNGRQEKEKLNNGISNVIKITAAHNAHNDEAYADLNFTAEDFAITKYYGTYGDCVVFMIKNLFFELPTVDLEITDVIAGVDFYYSSTDKIMVWKI